LALMVGLAGYLVYRNQSGKNVQASMAMTKKPESSPIPKKTTNLQIPEKKNLDPEIVKQQLEDTKREVARLKEQIESMQKPPAKAPAPIVPEPEEKLPYPEPKEKLSYEEAFKMAGNQFVDDVEAYCKLLKMPTDAKGLDEAAKKVLRSSRDMPKASFENPDIKHPHHGQFRNFVSRTIVAVLETQDSIGKYGLVRGRAGMNEIGSECRFFRTHFLK